MQSPTSVIMKQSPIDFSTSVPATIKVHSETATSHGMTHATAAVTVRTSRA
jgi:hypothetical protein